MKEKIQGIHQDINNIFNDWDGGKIDDKTANFHIRSLCETYLK